MRRTLTAVALATTGLWPPAVAFAQSCPASVGGVLLDQRLGPEERAIAQPVCSTTSGNCWMLCKYGTNPSLPELKATVEWRPAAAGPLPQYPGTCINSTAGNVFISRTRQALVSWIPGNARGGAELARALLGQAEGQSAVCPSPVVPGRGRGNNPGIETSDPFGGPPPPPPVRPNRPPDLHADRYMNLPVSPTLDDEVFLSVYVSDPDGDPVSVRVGLWRDQGRYLAREWRGTVTPRNGVYEELSPRFPNVGAPGEYVVRVTASDGRGAEVSDEDFGRFRVRRPVAILRGKTMHTEIVRAPAQFGISRRDPAEGVHGPVAVNLYWGDQVKMCGWGAPRNDTPAEISLGWPGPRTWAVIRFDPRRSPVLCYTLTINVTTGLTDPGEDLLLDGTLNVAQEAGEWVVERWFRQIVGAGVASVSVTLGGMLMSPTNPGASIPTLETSRWRRTIDLRSEVLVRQDASSLNVRVFEGTPAVRDPSGPIALRAGQEVSFDASGGASPVRAFDPGNVTPWWRAHAEPDFSQYSTPEWQSPVRREIAYSAYATQRLAQGDGSVSFANNAFVVRSSRELATYYGVGRTLESRFDAVATIGSVAGTGPAGAGLYLSRSPAVAIVSEGDIYFGRAPGGVLLQLRRNNQWENLQVLNLPAVDGWDRLAISRDGDQYRFLANNREVARYTMPGRGAERVDFFTAPGAVAEMRQWSVAAW